MLQQVSSLMISHDAGAGNDIYLTLAGGVGRMQHWLQHKANSQALQPAGAQRFEGVWAGKQVRMGLNQPRRAVLLLLRLPVPARVPSKSR